MSLDGHSDLVLLVLDGSSRPSSSVTVLQEDVPHGQCSQRSGAAAAGGSAPSWRGADSSHPHRLEMLTAALRGHGDHGGGHGVVTEVTMVVVTG